MIQVNGEKAPMLLEHLQKQQENGMEWAVYESNERLFHPADFTCFKSQWDASAYINAEPGDWLFLEYDSIKNLLYNLRKQQEKYIPETGAIPQKKEDNMNLNNLQDLKKELAELKFDQAIIDRVEEGMRKGLPGFEVKDQFIVDKGVIDQRLHIHKSSQSDFYYFGKYNVTLTRAKPLEEGQKYMVITPGENGKNMVKPFQSPAEAIAFFKEQKGTSELAAGKNAASKTALATMEGGKVNYVHRPFEVTFRSEPVTQTFYVNKGKGFTSEQANNLVQGRAVYRDDLLKASGEMYKAWVLFDKDQAKDRNDNFRFKQYHDPAYGFHLNKVLERYPIKGMDDAAQKERLMAELKEGNRVPVTMVRGGKETSLLIEAVPRYGNVNLYRENGKPERREDYDLTAKQDRTVSRSQSRERELASERGMRL